MRHRPTLPLKNGNEPPPKRPGIRRVPPLWLMVLILLALQPLALFAGSSLPGQRTVTVGFSSKVFPDVDQRDALIAMEMWTKELARVMGVNYLPQTRIFRNPGDLLAAVQHGELSIVTMPAIEFVNMRDKAPMTPVIVSADNAGKGRQYVLIVRQDSGINSLAELSGFFSNSRMPPWSAAPRWKPARRLIRRSANS